MVAKTQVIQQTTSNIPEYARPYYEDLLKRGQGESYRPYIPYGYTQDPTTGEVVKDPNADAQRLAGFTPAQLATQNAVMGMKSPEGFSGAYGALGMGLDALSRTQSYNPAQFQAMLAQAQQVGAERVQGPNLQQFQMEAPQQFGQAQAQQYMSPYVQNVLDVQKREAMTDAQKAQLAQNLGAVRQGTYGGSRQLLATTERERALGQQLGDIQSRGLQSSYENAQSQFERDRAAKMGAGNINLQAQLGVQGLGAETGLRAALANQQTGLQAGMANQQTGLQAALANQQAGLEAQRLGEASRQFGANLGLQGAQAYGQFGQTYANVGSAQQQADLQRFNAQNAIGAQQQAQQQQGYDIKYGDFLRQQNYPMEQLGYMSNILRGLPNAVNTTQTTSAPGANPWAQAAGAGLSALSYAKLLG